MFKWTVEFEVSENWVADGFEVTDESALEMLTSVLGWAYENELKARVVKRPSEKAINVAQGYAAEA